MIIGFGVNFAGGAAEYTVLEVTEHMTAVLFNYLLFTAVNGPPLADLQVKKFVVSPLKSDRQSALSQPTQDCTYSSLCTVLLDTDCVFKFSNRLFLIF